MNPTAFADFTRRLRARLEADPDVLGLVLLGSTSGQPPGPDAFSDHDFFVVTRSGAQERLRQDRSWLPDPGRIALAFRETAHGVKVLWDGGHLAEFAVFDPGELALARVNRYAVAFDRGDVASRMTRVREATDAAVAAAAPGDPAWHAGQLLSNLLVGAGRYARGERLAGHQLVRTSAVGHLVALLRAGLGPAETAGLDGLDPFRRLEGALPAAAAALDAALALPVPRAARALLALAARERPGLVGARARAAVEAALDEADRAAGPGPGAG